ncbi:hypothetical protein T10_10571, partial [Trichinella papuae]
LLPLPYCALPLGVTGIKIRVKDGTLPFFLLPLLRGAPGTGIRVKNGILLACCLCLVVHQAPGFIRLLPLPYCV